MSSKVASTLAAQQKSFEALKKKADLFLKEFKKFKKSKKNRDELPKYSDRCKELLQETDSLLEEAESPLDDEVKDAKRRKSFETKKKQLVGKITSLREQLSNVQETISSTIQAEDEIVDKTSPTDATQNEETAVRKSSKSLSAKVRESFRFDRSKKNKNKKGKGVKNGEEEPKEEKPEEEELEDSNDLVEDITNFKDDVKDIEDVDDDDEEESEEEKEEEESEEEKEKEKPVAAATAAAAVVEKSPPSQTEKSPETKEKKEEKTKKEKTNVDTADSEKLKTENMAENSNKVPVKKPFLQKFLPNKRKTTETKEKAPIPESEISNPKKESNLQNGEKATVTEKKTDIVVAPKPVPRTTGKKLSEENQKPLVPSENVTIQETKKSADVLDHESKVAVKSGEKVLVEDDDDEEEEEEEEEEESEDDDDEEEEESEEEESEEEEEEEGEEEEEEEDDDDDLDITGKQFIALQDFAKQEKNDLAFKKNQVLTILRANEDGWWDAMDTSGNKGLVPKTYLRLYPAVREKDKPRQKIEAEEEEEEEEDDYDDEEEEDDDEEEEEEDDEEEDDDEDEEDEEDKNSKVVPNEESSVNNKNQSGKNLWKALQKSVTETSIIDVLHGMGAIPSGFRSSTLANLYHTNPKYRMSHSLHPNLSTSALNFKDLFYSPSENKIQPYSVNLQRIVTLVSCRYIPTIGARLEMIKRTVRVCLFNGKNILSNIHVIKTSSVDKSQRTWNFSANLSNNSDVSQHAEFFIRTNHTGPNVSLLFELGITYIHTETKERGEFSTGWQLLPLNVENVTLPNQNYDLYLQGGTPYERGVPLDSTATRAMEENTLRNMIYGHQKPMLNIKVVNPKREQKDLLDCLPETIIGNLCLLPFYSIYRNILARSLLWDRPNIDNTELLHSPILSTFPLVADQYELMQLLRDTWTEKQRELTRGSKRDDERQKKLFVDAFMEAVYPMSHSLDFSGSNDEAQRYDALQKFKNLKTERQSALAILLSDDIVFEPLDLEEVTFSIMHPFNLQEG